MVPTVAAIAERYKGALIANFIDFPVAGKIQITHQVELRDECLPYLKHVDRMNFNALVPDGYNSLGVSKDIAVKNP